MRIAWRWVLPIVPLMILAMAGRESHVRDGDDPRLRQYRAQYGEIFSCQHLWASREAYEEDKKSGWGPGFDCFLKPLERAAIVTNLAGALAGHHISQTLLVRFDIPMMPTFYGAAFATSFAFWYIVGACFDGRRIRSTELMDTKRDPSLRSG
jgi:hypothetical protein